MESFLDFIEKYYTKLMTFIVNLQDDNENTALHYAISYNNFDIVSVLLDSKKCDVNRFNKVSFLFDCLSNNLANIFFINLLGWLHSNNVGVVSQNRKRTIS